MHVPKQEFGNKAKAKARQKAKANDPVVNVGVNRQRQRSHWPASPHQHAASPTTNATAAWSIAMVRMP